MCAHVTTHLRKYVVSVIMPLEGCSYQNGQSIQAMFFHEAGLPGISCCAAHVARQYVKIRIRDGQAQPEHTILHPDDR